MDIDINLYKKPFSSEFIKKIAQSAALIFGEARENSLRWRLENMPEVTVFVALAGSDFVGFKAGYAATDSRYYSWLGGIDPKCRNNGIAALLMSRQHEWLLNSNFNLVETYVSQSNNAMQQLNHKFGLEITGNFLKDKKPFFIMQKNLNP